METKKVKIIRLPSGEWYMDKLHKDAVLAEFVTDSGVGPQGGLTTKDVDTNFPVEYRDQHLYFITDDEIKEGDFVLYDVSDYQGETAGLKYLLGKVLSIEEVGKANAHYTIENYSSHRFFKEQTVSWHCSLCKKVITTTNSKLRKVDRSILNKKQLSFEIPQIPQSFIEEYCRKEGIGELLVEYFTYTNAGNSAAILEEGFKNEKRIKVNPDNTINIYPVENKVYDKDEVNRLCRRAYSAAWSERVDHLGRRSTEPKIDKWIEENL